MATYSKLKLSGSTDGKGIKVTATSIGSGDTIHTAGSSGIDLVTLFAVNHDASPAQLNIGWGGTTDPDDLITQTIPVNSGLSLLTADQPIGNSLIIKAAASVANKVIIFGYVNRVV